MHRLFLPGFLAFALIAVAFGGDFNSRPNEGLHHRTPAVVAFTGITLQITAEERIANATLLIRNGVVESAGSEVTIPPEAMVFNLTGKWIYPGFIDLGSSYGQGGDRPARGGEAGEGPGRDESSATSAGGAHHWNSKVQPQVSVMDTFKSDAEAAAKLRQAGFTTVNVLPRTGVFGGSSALVLLGEGEPGDLILDGQTAQSISLVVPRGRGRDEYPSSLMGVIALIRQTVSDARWYGAAWKTYRGHQSGQEAPETNASLAALLASLDAAKPFIFQAEGEWDALSAARLAAEFGLTAWIKESGSAYRRAELLKAAGAQLIVPLKFPDQPDVVNPDDEMEITLQELKTWFFAPENAGRLAAAGIPFVLSTGGLDKPKDLVANLRATVERGLEQSKALAALTSQPAAWLGKSESLGSLLPGRIANFFIADGDLFAADTTIVETWVGGRRFGEKPETGMAALGSGSENAEPRGTWPLVIDGNQTLTLDLSGKLEKLKAEITKGKGKAAESKKVEKVGFHFNQIEFRFDGALLSAKGSVRANALIDGDKLLGELVLPDGSRRTFSAVRAEPHVEKSEKKPKPKPPLPKIPLTFPNGAYGRQAPPDQPQTLLIRNATLWTAADAGIMEGADLLITNGKISAIGRNLEAADGALIIDAAGKHVTPGLIDTHSHTAIRGGVNEGTHANTAEVRIGEVLDPDDINIYRQLAGGVTMANLLHGSANPIGGQNAVAKWRWGADDQAMLFDGAMPGIKFALGENVKQSNWGEAFTTRYPQTRMGVEQFFRDAFQAAVDYRNRRQAYERAADRGQLVPPRKDWQSETLLEIMDGKRQIHCHSYRQDEILALIRVADVTGFKVDTFTHCLEGYKVADAMAAHGAMASIFTDWWAYKYEVIDAIPHNGAIMHDAGITVSFKSDSDELARHLNTEAAKAIKYGGLSPEEAIKFVTINPAKQLRADSRVGSLEVGKDADLAIWSGSPLSTYSICEQTWIDGRKYFDRADEAGHREAGVRQRGLIVQYLLAADSGETGDKAKGKKEEEHYECGHDFGHGEGLQ